jgi:hypothetical protein
MYDPHGYNIRTSASSRPLISVALSFFGIILMVASAIAVSTAFTSESSSAIVSGGAGFIVALLLFGLASGLHKFHEIEFRLAAVRLTGGPVPRARSPTRSFSSHAKLQL